ncbi:MAG: DNA topoisomerase IB [Candidatus Eremiobacteraeota bacterium]|nr:DNA topoisomerase IB [Candidatus Eremiobacteraeota bacterium]
MIEATDPVAAARAAGLRYVSDQMPGIRRRRAGNGFAYVGSDQKTVVDPAVLARIRALAIPPAYDDVWICPDPSGHLQATGRDARGRKQYRYHKDWREVRDEAKFDRMLGFAKSLPAIRERVERDLSLPGLPREKVLATVVRLLELTLIRVGNDEYARANRSYGLTTLRDRHVRVDGTRVRFHFRGKRGIVHEVGVRDRRLAAILRRLVEIPGQELFEYLDDAGHRHTIHSQDVNTYLREIAGSDFSAKDFRTLAGTVLCALALAAAVKSQNQRQARENVAAAVKSVAERLGNTPAVCRKAYIHPAIIDEYLAAGSLRLVRARNGSGSLTADERCVIRTIERLAKRDEPANLTSLLQRSVGRRRRSSAGGLRASGDAARAADARADTSPRRQRQSGKSPR